MQIFGQKIVFHSSKRVNSIAKQHKLSICLDIKTITEKQSVQSLFIFRASSFFWSPIPVSAAIQGGRCSAKEIGIFQSAPCYPNWYLVCHYLMLGKTNENRTFCQQMISQLKEELTVVRCVSALLAHTAEVSILAVILGSLYFFLYCNVVQTSQWSGFPVPANYKRYS